MNKSAIFGLFLLISLLMGTSLNMNMFSPVMGAMGQEMGQYYDNNNDYQSTYEKDAYEKSYSNSYNYERQQPYNNGYDKSSYFMDSYGDRYNDHKDKINKYECRTGPFEGFFVSSVEFCDAKNKFNDDNKVNIFPPDGLLTADWWKWVIAIPSESNPLLDETGDNCDVNQQGPVWFLVGTPGDTTTGNLTTGDAERDCVIPEGKKILFPIFNTFCSELNDQISGPQVEEGLRQCAEDIINEVDILEASIDGKSITNFEKFRVQSPLFTISIPEDNAFGITNFTNIPQKAISDGYWVEVKGLDPGEHTIEFTGGATAFKFTTHVLYHITIEPTNNNDNNYYDNSN
ncbi:MAG: hypothetical protein ACXW2E_05515 [Nitrososphaeraceae archaeon]